MYATRGPAAREILRLFREGIHHDVAGPRHGVVLRTIRGVGGGRLGQARTIFSVGDRLAGGRLVGDRPVGDRLVGDRLVGERPVGERPVGERPVGERPVDFEGIGVWVFVGDRIRHAGRDHRVRRDLGWIVVGRGRGGGRDRRIVEHHAPLGGAGDQRHPHQRPQCHGSPPGIRPDNHATIPSSAAPPTTIPTAAVPISHGHRGFGDPANGFGVGMKVGHRDRRRSAAGQLPPQGGLGGAPQLEGDRGGGRGTVGDLLGRLQHRHVGEGGGGLGGIRLGVRRGSDRLQEDGVGEVVGPDDLGGGQGRNRDPGPVRQPGPADRAPRVPGAALDLAGGGAIGGVPPRHVDGQIEGDVGDPPLPRGADRPTHPPLVLLGPQLSGLEGSRRTASRAGRSRGRRHLRRGTPPARGARGRGSPGIRTSRPGSGPRGPKSCPAHRRSPRS